MEEGVAGPIGEFDESKAFVRIESTGLSAVGVDVEFATPRMTQILISQFWFLVGSCPITDRATMGWLSRTDAGLGFDMIGSWSENAAGRSGIKQVVLWAAWVKGKRAKWLLSGYHDLG